MTTRTEAKRKYGLSFSCTERLWNLNPEPRKILWFDLKSIPAKRLSELRLYAPDLAKEIQGWKYADAYPKSAKRISQYSPSRQTRRDLYEAKIVGDIVYSLRWPNIPDQSLLKTLRESIRMSLYKKDLSPRFLLSARVQVDALCAQLKDMRDILSEAYRARNLLFQSINGFEKNSAVLCRLKSHIKYDHAESLLNKMKKIKALVSESDQKAIGDLVDKMRVDKMRLEDYSLEVYRDLPEERASVFAGVVLLEESGISKMRSEAETLLEKIKTIEEERDTLVYRFRLA